RFYRVDTARTPGRGGLGLGLAIVKHMVQYMDGRLDLRSREGVGTVATLTLPKTARRAEPAG
ncbi:MAG: ATP-binding protein, partial [Deinococcales bacterium]